MNKEYCSGLPVDAEAARLAVEWKELFASELRTAAQKLAGEAKLVTVEHYRRALASATERVLHTVNTHCTESADVHRRVA